MSTTTVSLLINNVLSPKRQHHIAVEAMGETLPEPKFPYTRYDVTVTNSGFIRQITTRRCNAARQEETVQEVTLKDGEVRGVLTVHNLKMKVGDYVFDYTDKAKGSIEVKEFLRRLCTPEEPFEVRLNRYDDTPHDFVGVRQPKSNRRDDSYRRSSNGFGRPSNSDYGWGTPHAVDTSRMSDDEFLAHLRERRGAGYL